MIYLSHRERQTRVLGPGLRYALWVQGCKKRCPGCVFPEGQPLDQNGTYVAVDELIGEIMATQGIRGVTISGGEPFLQAKPLLKLIKTLRAQTKLDIMVYSGYQIEELQAKGGDTAEILRHIDLLVDGEYIESQNTDTAYRGSDNQRIHALTPKYRPYLAMMLKAKNRSMEFVCNKSGDLFMIGIPAKNFRENFMKTVEQTIPMT